MDIQQELTEEEREIVAARLLDEQRDRFDGVRKAAYIAAGVNPATWTRAVGAQRVRPDRLVQIVKSLWPDSGGRWDAVPQSNDYSWSGVPDYVQQGPWTSEVENAMADVDGRFLAMEARVRDLEHLVAELIEDESDEQKEGEGHGAQTTPKKTELDRLREQRAAAGQEVSEGDDTLSPAADDVKPDDDEEPGGS